jgi:hypothetical protein
MIPNHFQRLMILEDILGISVSQKDSKPLRVFDALIKDISSN